jgi:insecticidal toxin complex protein TccC
MNTGTRSEINRGTPNVTVHSNQGLAVRQLQFYRREVGEAAQVRTHLRHYNSAGQLKSGIDPRLSSAYLKNSSATIPNQQQQNTLSSKVLKSDNVDAGTRVLFSDVRGLALWSWDSRGTESRFDHDKLRRVSAVHEKERGKESVCRERFRYGEASDIGAKNNTVGQLIKHYDTAGLQLIPEYNLLGTATQSERTFLKAEAIVNWTEDEQENIKALEEQSYLSSSESNALGETLSQIDAANNARHTRYDIAGQVSQTTLQLPGEAEKTLTHHRLYRATGQLQSETLGNGVQLHYTYEVDTQRLKEKLAARLSDDKVLQSLHYSYDPVGNILSIADQAQEPEYYKNDKTESINHYVYDSLYQLISADGVESEQTSCETSCLPHAITFGNNDASRLVPYQRHYDYDAGGNLFEIKHRGANTCTQELTIESLSNRGIEKRSSGPTLQESFDANGNLLYLNIGKLLSWNARNQLQETIQIERADNISDKESYLYDGLGVRVQKTRIYLTETQIHTERVRYLSGVELREHWQTGLQEQNKRITEELHLISAQAGDVPVKVLHWETGKPDAIENDATYYSLSDHLGSNQIELNNAGEITSFESYYPYGGTAIWSSKNQIESNYKYTRYSGKERDHSGLYYYGYRYYMPWLGRWLSADPSGVADGLNLFRMARNNPITFVDDFGKAPTMTLVPFKTNKFSDLYLLRNPGTKEQYHYVQDIPGEEWLLNINVKVFPIRSEREIREGRKGALLFTGASEEGVEQAKTLVIYAHGAVFKEKKIVQLKCTPILTLLDPYTTDLTGGLDPKLTREVYATASAKKVRITSENAQEDFEKRGHYPITGVESPGLIEGKPAMQDSKLQKLETPRKKKDIEITEGNRIMYLHQREIIAYMVSMSYKKEGGLEESFDVITPQKGSEASFAKYYNFAEKRKYTNIICLFCRGLENEENPNFFSSQLRLLAKPDIKDIFF